MSTEARWTAVNCTLASLHVGDTIMSSLVVLPSCSSVVGVELVRTLRARVEDRRSLIGATCLSLAELHLRVVALRTFFVGDLLCARNILSDRERGEAVALALECGRIVGRTRVCVHLVWPLV